MKGLHQRTCDNCGAIVWAEEDFGDYTSWDSYYTTWTFYAHEDDDMAIEVCPECGSELEEDSTTEIGTEAL